MGRNDSEARVNNAFSAIQKVDDSLPLSTELLINLPNPAVLYKKDYVSSLSRIPGWSS